MKIPKYFSIIIIGFLASSCNMIGKNDVPYELKDTWGENGDWSNNKNESKEDKKVKLAKENVNSKKDENKKENEITKEKLKEEDKTDNELKQDKNKEEINKEDTNSEKELNNKEVSNNQSINKEEIGKDELNISKNETKNIFKDDKLSVELDVSSWQEKESISKVRLFSKDFDNSEVILSLALIKGLNNKLLDNSFKDKYINSLKSKLKDFQLITNTEENISSKKAWSISYSSLKNDAKLQQKQLFIPNKDNTLVVNVVSDEETMFKAESNISKTLNSIKFY